jgi:serine/threonine protein kinase
MEYCHGINLKEYLKRNKELTEETVRRIFRGIVAAVEYCHGQKVAHRDIKLENIIIDEEKMEVKVIDFGFSSTLGHPD